MRRLRPGGWATALLVLPLVAATAIRAEPPAPPPTLGVELDRSTLTVGDPVRVTATLRLSGNDSTRPATLIGLEARWGEAEVLAPPQLVDSGERAGALRTWTFPITAFRPGRLELPALEVRLDGDPPRTFRAAPLELDVRSVLPPDGPAPEPMPSAPLRAQPVPAAVFWTLGVAAAAIALATALLARRRHPPARSRTPVVPPFVELERALAALAGAPPEAAHVGVSRSLRRFLGRRLEFPAVESTTRQIARRLAERDVESALARRTVRLLGDCDGVKFARRPATSGDADARAAAALEAARELERALAPPAPSAPEASS